ncbi:MAG: hypothetical protein ABIR24_13675 [Verrucomicrobiota bacterium]
MKRVVRFFKVAARRNDKVSAVTIGERFLVEAVCFGRLSRTSPEQPVFMEKSWQPKSMGTFALGKNSMGAAACVLTNPNKRYRAGESKMHRRKLALWNCELFQKEKNRRTSRRLIFKTLFVTGVSAWRIVTQFALSNFVLIPKKL